MTPNTRFLAGFHRIDRGRGGAMKARSLIKTHVREYGFAAYHGLCVASGRDIKNRDGWQASRTSVSRGPARTGGDA